MVVPLATFLIPALSHLFATLRQATGNEHGLKAGCLNAQFLSSAQCCFPTFLSAKAARILLKRWPRSSCSLVTPGAGTLKAASSMEAELASSSPGTRVKPARGSGEKSCSEAAQVPEKRQS